MADTGTRPWAWSLDPESGYRGPCETRKEAIGEALDEAACDLDVGQRVTISLGRVVTAVDRLEAQHERIGLWLGEFIEEVLDFPGLDDPAVEIPKGRAADLGRVVVDWLSSVNAFNGFMVEAVEEVVEVLE